MASGVPVPARLGRPRAAGRRRPWPGVGPVAYVPLYGWLIALVLLPLGYLVVYSFWQAQDGTTYADWTTANYDAIARSDVYTALVVRTLLTAGGAALLATAIAYPMAYVVARKLSQRRLLAVLLVVVPLWVSFLVRVFAWKLLLGERGALNSVLMTLRIIDQPSEAFLYTRLAVFITLTYVCIPYVFVTAYTALERIPESLVEASADAGASRWRTFRSVLWPLSRTGAAVGFMLAFLICVGDYLTPSLVGGTGGTMLGSVVVSQFGAVGNWPLGAAMALTLMVAVAVLLLLAAPLVRARGVLDGESSAPTAREPSPASTLGHRVLRGAGWGLFALPYALLYLPLAVIVLFSFNASEVQAFPISGLTTKWYSAVFEDGPMLASVGHSLVVAVCVVVLSGILGTAFAMVVHFRPSRASGPLQALLAIPVLLPGTVLGLALAITFREGGLPFGLLTVALGHLSYCVPIVMLVVLARLRRLDPSLVHASQDCGASPWRTLIHVLLPQIRTALLGALLLAFTLSFDEIVMTFFLSGTKQTLPVFVWSQLRFGFTPAVNAVLTMIVAVSLVVILVAVRLLRSDGPGRPARTDALPTA